MDVGADAAGQVISLAGQVFKIGMEGMVVVVKIAGKGAAHAAALLAAALSGKKKTKGKVMLKNMLRDSKGITLFTIKESDLAKFAKEAKAYNVRYCIVKEKKQDRADGNTDMFIRAEDAAVVNRIIERFGLTAVKQDVSIEGAPEAERVESEPAKDEDYVYGDITISREANSLVDEAGETETQIKTRVPGTYGKDVRYVYFDKAGLEEAHGGKSYKAHIEPEGSYELYDKAGAVAETVSGEELLTHYDRHDNEVIPGNSKARTASEAQSGKSYSAQEDDKETESVYVAFESYYEYSGGDEEYLYDERCRLLGIGGNGGTAAYPGHEEFFRNEDELNAYLEEHKELKCVSKEELEDIEAGRHTENKAKETKEKLTERTNKSSRSENPSVSPDKEKQPDSVKQADGGQPDYVYGDVTISREVNSLVEEESETQIKTRVPGTYGKDIRYVYFDKAGLEEAHGGKSYKVHIEPEKSYELYNKAGAVAETVYGEELLTHYDRKDKDTAPENQEAVKTKTSEKSAVKPAEESTKPENASSEKSYEDAVHEGSKNAKIPDTKNRFNRFSQRTYDFDAMGKELLSNNKEPKAAKPAAPEPRPEAEMRPSVREKLSGYKKEEENEALKRQIEAAQAKRAAETKELGKTGDDVLPGQRAKMDSYIKSRDAAMADFLSDAKLPDKG